MYLPPVNRSDANTILIVDDDVDIVTLFGLLLKKQGFHVSGFTSPSQAVEHFQINFRQYVLVISDIRMPEMNGYEFIKWSRR